MLSQLFLSMLTMFGYAQVDVPTAFTLFKNGKYKEATELIRTLKYYDVLKAVDAQEHSLFIAAVIYGNTLDTTCSQQEKFLLQEAALDCILEKTAFDSIYINHRDTNWQTALTHAVKQGYDHLAQYLYMHGIDPRIKDIYGKTARDYAEIDVLRQSILSWEWESVEMMQDHRNVWRLMRAGTYKAACSSGMSYFGDFEFLSTRDCMGNSLIIAPILFSFAISSDISSAKKEEMILYFLDEVYENIADRQGRDELLDVQNNQGQTALMWAAKYGYEGVIHWLLRRGANLLLRDMYGRRASDYTTHKQLKDYLEDRQIQQEISWRL